MAGDPKGKKFLNSKLKSKTSKGIIFRPWSKILTQNPRYWKLNYYKGFSMGENGLNYTNYVIFKNVILEYLKQYNNIFPYI